MAEHITLVGGFQVVTKPITDSIAFMESDLARSGLLPKDLYAEAKECGPATTGEYIIPYFTRQGEKLDNMYRIRVERTEWMDADGNLYGKYYGPSAKQVGALAVLPYMHPKLLTMSRRIVHIHEGEKKACAAVKAGRFAIGIGGAHNWRAFGKQSEVHPDILALCKGSEEVWLWPDGDVLSNPNVSQGWGSLARCLEQAGHTVRCYDLQGKKYDDLLVELEGNADAVEATAEKIDLVRLSINHAVLRNLVPGLTTVTLGSGDQAVTRIQPTESNLRLILKHYGPTAGRFWFDAERNCIMDGAELATEQTMLADLVDLFQNRLSFNGRVTASRSTIRDALEGTMYQDVRTPFRDYLQSVVWDGVERLSFWMRDWCGGEDTPFARDVARKLLISSVARVMRPGCDLRWMCIMVGPQRCGKSGLPRALWGADKVKIMNTADTEKDALLALSMHLVANYDELSAFYKRSETAALKSIISTTHDVYRKPYEASMKPHPRRCIILGSTNDPEFLPRDNSGNNRYVMVRVGANGLFDFDSIYKYRDQLWAEAVRAFHAGEPYEYVEGADENAEQYIQEDSLVDMVRTRLSTRKESTEGLYLHENSGAYCVKALEFGAVFGIDPLNISQTKRLAAALVTLGFKKQMVRHKTQGRTNFYTMEGEQFKAQYVALPKE